MLEQKIEIKNLENMDKEKIVQNLTYKDNVLIYDAGYRDYKGIILSNIASFEYYYHTDELTNISAFSVDFGININAGCIIPGERFVEWCVDKEIPTNLNFEKQIKIIHKSECNGFSEIILKDKMEFNVDENNIFTIPLKEDLDLDEPYRLEIKSNKKIKIIEE